MLYHVNALDPTNLKEGAEIVRLARSTQAKEALGFVAGSTKYKTDPS